MGSAERKPQEERVKLFASALSNVGVATIVAGFVGPSIAQHLNPAIAVGSVMFGFGAHLAAQCVLHYVASEAPDEDVAEDTL